MAYLPHRDSLVWTFGLVTAIVTALAGVDGLDLLPASYHHPIALAAFVLGVVSAYAKASPLPKA